MTITVGIHPDSYETTFFEAAKGRRAFTRINALEGDGRVAIFLPTPASCDELIKAGVLAKSMLLGETSEPVSLEAYPAVAAYVSEYTAPSAAAVAEGVEGEPPHLVRKGEVICDAHSEPQVEGEPDSYFICTAQAGHAGPGHVAFFSDGSAEWARWPVASPLAPPAPYSTPAAEIPATDGA